MSDQAALLDIIERPQVTDKSYRLAEISNTAAFRVRKSANKLQIKKAIEQAFDVTVESVRTVSMKGKARRSGRRRTPGYTSDWKKAYVTLAEGSDINLLDSE